MRISLNNSTYIKSSFENELELEKAVVANIRDVFGKKSVYFDVKKRIKIRMDSQKFVPQGSRFTQFSFLEKATKLSDIF